MPALNISAAQPSVAVSAYAFSAGVSGVLAAGFADTALLDRGVRKLFPDLRAPATQWLGFRLSLRDSLPVIEPSRRHPGLIHAFGHGHLGMTLAAVTSLIVAGLVEEGNGAWDLTAFRVDRFR